MLEIQQWSQFSSMSKIFFCLKVIHRHEVRAKIASVSGSTLECCLKLLKISPWSFQQTHPFFAYRINFKSSLSSNFQYMLQMVPRTIVTLLLSYAIHGLSGHSQVYSNLSSPSKFLSLRFCVRSLQDHL